jgi:L-alanine-DL-glutamate epimerase-like enolase superfamily enzyme
MRVERLQTILVNVPLRTEQRTSFGGRMAMTQCLVRATADTGQTGWGEASGGAGGWAPACQAIIEAMKDRVVGRPPEALAAMREELFDVRYWKNAGRLAHMAFGAVETALLDLRARGLGVPLWRLLGDKIRDEVDFFGFLDRTLGLEELVEQALEMERQGFGTLYLKVGLDEQSDLGCVARIRQAIRPQTGLRLDANGAWSPEQAIRMIGQLAESAIEFVEQPTPLSDLPALASVRRAVAVPICANEVAWYPEEWQEVLRQDAADVLCINVAWCGGPTRVMRVAQMARARGIRFVRHTIDIGINDLATLHILATIPEVMDGNQIMGAHLGDDVIEGGPLLPRAGKLRVPNGPGLGMTVNEAKVEELHERFLKDGNATGYRETRRDERS